LNASGKFFLRGQAVRSKLVTYDTELAARLWTISEQLTELHDPWATAGRESNAIGAVRGVRSA
jgi:hypothetical protein